nr:phage protein Gp27 family protein [uncultured Neokomagataea sp.]
MARKSSIERLPEAVRQRIQQLLDGGHTLDEILEALEPLGVVGISRSALGRYTKATANLTVWRNRSRDVAQALAAQLGTAEVGRHAQLNIELLHTTILDLFLKAQDPESGADLSKGAKAAMSGDPMGISLLARALESLSKASKTDIEYRADVEKHVREALQAEAKENIGVIAKSQGLSAETAAALMSGAFGVK